MAFALNNEMKVSLETAKSFIVVSFCFDISTPFDSFDLYNEHEKVGRALQKRGKIQYFIFSSNSESL